MRCRDAYAQRGSLPLLLPWTVLFLTVSCFAQFTSDPLVYFRERQAEPPSFAEEYARISIDSSAFLEARVDDDDVTDRSPGTSRTTVGYIIVINARFEKRA